MSPRTRHTELAGSARPSTSGDPAVPTRRPGHHAEVTVAGVLRAEGRSEDVVLVLPEGMLPTRMYDVGLVESWWTDESGTTTITMGHANAASMFDMACGLLETGPGRRAEDA